VIFIRGVVAIGALSHPPDTPKARLRGEKSLAFGPGDDIRAEQRPQGRFGTDFVIAAG
jgi:hypothetical protein